MALISSSVGNLKSGFSTHQLESIPGIKDTTMFNLSSYLRPLVSTIGMCVSDIVENVDFMVDGKY